MNYLKRKLQHKLLIINILHIILIFLIPLIKIKSIW